MLSDEDEFFCMLAQAMPWRRPKVKFFTQSVSGIYLLNSSGYINFSSSDSSTFAAIYVPGDYICALTLNGGLLPVDGENVNLVPVG